MMQGQVAAPKTCSMITIVTIEGDKAIQHVFRMQESPDDKGEGQPGTTLAVVYNFPANECKCLTIENDMGKIMVKVRDNKNRELAEKYMFNPGYILRMIYKEI